MNNNRPKVGKNKNIKRKAEKRKKRPQQKKEQFSFQEDMVDLISDSDSQLHERLQHIDKDEQNQMLDQSKIDKNIQLGNGSFLYAIQYSKFYNGVLKHQQIGKTQIKTIFEKDTLNINGKQLRSSVAYQNFVFSLQQSKQQNSTISKENLSKEFGHEDDKVLKQFLKGVNLKRQTLLIVTLPLQISECFIPWEGLPPCVNGNESLMILGQKNSGKSTLAQYLLNTKGQDCALLDCDIGRNSCMEGCISLTSGEISRKIWIGQFSPLNNLQTYLRGIRYLFNIYQEIWFTKKLIVNTMGYTTGLGQFLIYQIFQIIQPKSIIILQLPHQNTNDSLNLIVNNINNGTYVSKIYMSSSEDVYPCSSKFYYYFNHHAVSKKTNVSRFERQFQGEGRKISNVCDLLQCIRKAKGIQREIKCFHYKSRNEIQILEQSKHRKEDLEGMQTVYYRKLSPEQNIDMRLIVLGKMIQDTSSINFDRQKGQESSVLPLFEVVSLGYCFENQIYSISPLEEVIGIVNEGIDFQKKFYHLNQRQLIDLQLRMGRIPYLMVGTKGLGSKGVRNNPSKTTF